MSRCLPTRMVSRPWGRDLLPAPFVAPVGERIGEVWFESPPALDALLVKFIFTSQALSVQVHPSEVQAAAFGGTDRGKEECWLVTAADPGARLAIGFREPVDVETMRQAALDGSIENLLEWHPAQPGDFFYIPAGTVHAIGAGIALVEVQQNSETTYRLYDYGRPRELHLDRGTAVAKGGRHDASLRRRVPDHGSQCLVDGPLFRIDRLDGSPDAATRARYVGPVLVIPLEGTATIAGEVIEPGTCAAAPSLDGVALAGRNLVVQPCAADGQAG